MRKSLTRYFLLLLSCSVMSLSYAQISQGGQPYTQGKTFRNTVVQYDLTRPAQSEIDLAIAQNDRDGGYPVIAKSMTANISLTNSGTWISLPDGGRLWRAKLHAEEAQGLILGFNSFYLPQGANLFIYSEDYKEVLGAFTSENNHSSEQFATGVIQGDKVTVEYYEPASALAQGRFIINEVGYVFRMATPAPDPVIRNFGDSDPCQVNVNCTPEGTGWTNQKRGVVRILVKTGPSYGWCSGSVVNNTAQNCVPYVLLALHCGVTSSIADMNQWVFYFNFEGPGCPDPATQGTLANQSITGCTRRSDSNDGGGNTGSDYLLVQINSNIPAAYNAYYNGWNRATTAPTGGGKGIHHPAGDIKKISTYTATAVSSQWNGNGVQSHWRLNWVATTNGHGVTEGGSSGSPMFNSAGLIVGTLTGGSSYCTSPTSPDYYGKMSYHWNSNTAPTGGHLSTWLDPGNTGVTSLTGTYAPCGPTPPVCSFTPSATSIQAGQTVSFTDNSANATGWSWNFGGGGTPNTSTAQNPTNIVFNTPGVYTTTLIASNASGTCTTTVAITVTAQTGCDTINFQPPGALTVYTAGVGEYVCGWNSFGDISKAELIGPHAPYTHVNSMLVYFYGLHDGGNGASVNFNIWNNAGAGGSPGAVLASVNVPLAALDPLMTGPYSQGIVQVDFPTPVNVGAANYYIGINMVGFQADDSLGIVSNTDGNTTPGTAWEQWSDLSWFNMNDPSSWGLDITQFICPLMTNLPPTSNLTATPTTVCTGGSVTFNGTSSVNESGYNWTFPGGSPTTSTSATPSVTYNTAGTYMAYLEVDGVCAGYDVDSIQITVNNIPNVTATPTTPNICAGGSGVALTAAGGTTYSWSPATGLSGTTGATVTANPTTTTTYTVTGTTSGCSDPASVTVTVNPVPSISVTPSSATICTGGAGTSLTASGGTTYTWSPATGLSATTGATVTANPTTTTTYTVTGTTAGCSSSTTVTITVNTTPTVNKTPTAPTICTGGSGVAITASGATTYSWSPASGLSGTTGATVTANPASTQTYTISGTTAGCTGTTTVTVTVNPTPTVGVTPGSATICTGGSGTTLTASGATTYSWSPATGLSATTGAVVTANPTSTQTYTVTGTTAGCSSTAAATVTVNTTPTVNKTPAAPTICTGGSGVAITASGATTYSWSPATGLSGTTGATVTANPTTTTTYTITGTTAGCSATTTVTVTVNTTPTVGVTPGSATICTGGSGTTLTASGATTYSWSPATGLSATTGAVVTANPGSTQTYTVTGTTSGCSATATSTVTVNTTPTVGVSPTSTTICQGNSTTLTASGASTYSWSPATGLSATTGAVVTANPTTTQTYTVTGTTTGCSATATSTVTVTPTPVISVTPPNPGICTGGNVTMTASGATTYSWSPATGLSGTTGATVTSTPASTITYTITGTQSGCTGTGTVTVNVAPSLTINVSPGSASICTGGSGTTLTATGGTTYTWSPATGLSATTGAIVTANPTTTQTYTVTGTSGACNGSTTVTVTVNTTPTTGVTPTNATICNGASTTLTASGATTYSWSPATGLSATTGATVTASPTGTQTYTVTGTTGSCSSTATAAITVTPLPTVSVTPNTVSICAGSNTTLTASGATTYSWSPATGLSATTGATVTASPTSTQTYTVTGTQAGCDGIGTATVTVTPLPTVSVTPNAVSICAGNSTTLTASGATTYSWSPATGLSATTGATVTASPGSTQTYTVTGTTAGCDGTGTSTVTVNALPTPVASQSGNVLTCNPAGSSYQWYISTDGGATWNLMTGETNQTLTITQSAMYYVDMTDANGCTGSATGVTANYDAISELNTLWNLVIHPNPNSGLFEVLLQVGTPGEYQLEITDAAGRLVYSSTLAHVQKESKYTVDISKEQRGTYFLKLISEKKTVAVKRIVKM